MYLPGYPLSSTSTPAANEAPKERNASPLSPNWDGVIFLKKMRVMLIMISAFAYEKPYGATNKGKAMIK